MSVALLERAVDYTRGRLALVTPEYFGARTPCRQWNLATLLAHMEDSLDAFAEASQGVVGPVRLPIGEPRLQRLRAKACHLLGSWAAADVSRVRIGDRQLDAATLLAAAALEVAVHGWDVGSAVGEPANLPDALAVDLWPVAARLVTPDVRPGRFDDPVGLGSGGAKYAPDPSPGQELLQFLGRMTHQSHPSHP